MKNLANKTQNPPVPEKVIAKKKTQAISKPVKAVDNNLENNKKSSVEPEMGYDIVEDIKKTKANVPLFEMCNLPQQKNFFLEALGPQPEKYQDNVPLDKEINEASIGGKSKSRTKPFLRPLKF